MHSDAGEKIQRMHGDAFAKIINFRILTPLLQTTNELQTNYKLNTN